MSYLNNYPGSKGNSGCLQFLINNIPYHKRYFELFAGSAALFNAKAAADIAILCDVDSKVIFEHIKKDLPATVRLYNMPFKNVVQAYALTFTKDDFIYLDPPYPEISRRSGKKHYRNEMLSIKEHSDFLSIVQKIDANIMISTKPNYLYDQILNDWRKKEFDTVDHQGKYKEVIYMNYPEPELLHQYDFLGNGFIDRQRIKRKRQRMEDKIKGLPIHERMAILQDIVLHNSDHVQHFLSIQAAIEKGICAPG